MKGMQWLTKYLISDATGVYVLAEGCGRFRQVKITKKEAFRALEAYGSWACVVCEDGALLLRPEDNLVSEWEDS